MHVRGRKKEGEREGNGSFKNTHRKKFGDIYGRFQNGANVREPIRRLK